MNFTAEDYRYMRRALGLAAAGRGHVSPNPMVGAVIVSPDGRIIGEGWHRRYGGPHAEVNAVRDVADRDRHLLPQSTIYVTLEPCSHYGKTPPCAKLLVDIGIGRVVVGAGDPHPKVSGRGIEMLRQAGITVETGLLADESRRLNKTFMTAQTLHRPFVTLKWAQSADGFIDHRREAGKAAARFSTPLSSLLVHDLRSTHDAIAVGARTALLDRPRLDTRLVAGASPRRILFDRHGLVGDGDWLRVDSTMPLSEALHTLFADHNISSLLVEGGAALLGEFISSGLWDEAYVEVSPEMLGNEGTTPAPTFPCVPSAATPCDGNIIYTLVNPITAEMP